MSLLTITHLGTLVATAVHDGPSGSTVVTSDLVMPDGYRYLPADGIGEPKMSATSISTSRTTSSSVTWTVKQISINTVQLTVTATLYSDATVTAEIYGYLIDPTKYWGMESLSFMRRGVTPLN